MPQFSLTLMIAIGCGGAAGAICRYAVSLWSVRHFSASWAPAGTLIVNLAGAFTIGVLIVLLNERMLLGEHWRLLLVTGFLGALTTFSTFSLEVVQMLESGVWAYALAYVITSVLLCVLLVWLGMQLARVF